jgi:hypothetical protein
MGQSWKMILSESLDVADGKARALHPVAEREPGGQPE